MDAKGETQPAKTLTEDPPNSHKGSQKKLLSVEVKCISSILENCNRQVEIAVALFAILQSDKLSSIVDKDLSQALQEHQTLCERLETLEGLKQESDGEQEGEGSTARKTETAKLEEDIRNSARDLLRYFRGHPDAIIRLRSVQGIEAGESECKLIRGLKGFHSHMIEKLLISPDEELRSVFYAQASPSAAQDPEGMVSKEENLDTAMKQIDELILQEENEIQKLQNSLLEKTAQEMSISPLAEKQCQPLIKTSKKQDTIQQKIDQLNIQLNNLVLENRQAERIIQEKNEKLKNNIEYLLQSFDNKMEEIQTELETNEWENVLEEEELQRLEISFSVLKLECDQIQERRWLAEEKRKEDIRMLELKTKAGILIQAWWRGYSVRKALKNKGKSKKAKKSKGKKK
ncbi:hypothetical protein Q5P01_014536 [Channa striata]|uniref:Dynein regulatory complex protein 10 n=1 Tax=Channa striata TaxID=64152 RepID=A0AA88SMY8_CHASR|nr:hypothetical protein Q5P01_014536 [Channa striata]